jgi:hypothetical protein
MNAISCLLSIILILSLPIGRAAGVLWMFLCRNSMFVTTKLFDVAKFLTPTPLPLLCSCILSFPVVSLETSSLPRFVVKSLKNFHMVVRKVLEYLFLFLTEAVPWVIPFILRWCMDIQNSSITTVFCQHHIWQPITNKLCTLLICSSGIYKILSLIDDFHFCSHRKKYNPLLLPCPI